MTSALRTDISLPPGPAATTTPEHRGIPRDGVRLLVSNGDRHEHATFRELPGFIPRGSVLVVNRSAALPASLPARGSPGPFILNLSTRYADGIWLTEPRWSAALPGPLPLARGETFTVAGLEARLIAPHPSILRLWFIRIAGDVFAAMACVGSPIRYGYLEPPYPGIEAYSTVFGNVPGSVEMPSASRPFTARVLADLHANGVEVVPIVLHSGVSSIETDPHASGAPEAADSNGATDAHRATGARAADPRTAGDPPLYAEPFEVPLSTAAAINRARREGRPVIAVGTTVVRALETAWSGHCVRRITGFTRRYVYPGRPIATVDGLITGLHDPRASHLALLEALAGEDIIRTAYAAALRDGYLWHEFGDAHLILRRAS